MGYQPELINIKCADEVREQLRKENEFMAKRNEEWKAYTRTEFTNDMIGLGLLSLLLGVVFLNIVKYLWLASLLTLVVFLSYALPIFISRNKEPLYDFRITNYSIQSQFYLLTKDKNIVRVSIDNGTLHLVLDDIFSGERSFADIKRFESRRKTGIDRTQVDISNGKIYFPMSNR